MHSSSNNKRLAYNTLLLYLRMFVLMAIGLITSRIVLKTLGISDYGIYNVVAGAIMMIGFITSSFASASSRFITIAIGKGDQNTMKSTFGGIMAIQIILAIIIVFLAETVGLWGVKTFLVIPLERMNAALIIYQISIITCILNILYIPFNAVIVAYERMGTFAYLSILDAAMKLVVIYILNVVPFDKLITYAWLLFATQLLDIIIIYLYCIKNFIETRGTIKINRALTKDVMKYTTWTITGALTNMTCNQGINILLNMFFGPVVNAARGVAFQVQMMIQNFGNNFQVALNPQIVKSYATLDYNRVHSLVLIGTKFSFYLLLLFSLPVMLKIDFLLNIWLTEVPEHTSSFVRILLIINLIHCALANPLIFAINATGDIKTFQIVEGLCLVTILPISYLMYFWGDYSPELVFIVYAIIESFTQIARMLIVLPKIGITFIDYINRVFSPIFKVILVSVPIALVIEENSYDTWLSLVIITVASTFVLVFSIYFFGISDYERLLINDKVKNLKRNFFNHNAL